MIIITWWYGTTTGNAIVVDNITMGANSDTMGPLENI
jgi:hypothetical protein